MLEHHHLTDSKLGETGLDLLFRAAHLHGSWTDQPVTDQQLRHLYDTFKWAPTSFNGQPVRLVFCRSAAARERLAACAMRANRSKILSAPVTAIIAHDLNFYEKLPELATAHGGVAAMMNLYRSDPALTQEHAFRNGTLQGAYLLLAARALGLDCGPMSGFDNAQVDAEFFAASGFRSNFLCSLGYADRTAAHPRAPRLEFDRVCELA